MTVPNQGPEHLVAVAETGAGPLGEVWLVERRVGPIVELAAMKVLERRYPRDLDVLLAVRGRGRLLERAGVPGVVPIVHLARVGHHLALVRPWVDGLDVLEWVEILRERDVTLPTRVACEILAGAAGALAGALAAMAPDDVEPLAIEHRDFKPTNVLIRRDGEVRVVDFGCGFTSIAGRSGRAGALQKGLVRYLSPARREGKRGGPPADVYALGILAIELLRGRWLRRLHLHNPSHDRHLSEVVARLPPLGLRTSKDELALRNLLLRMVGWDPEGRPTAAEAHQTFRTLADRAPGPSLASWSVAHLVPHLWVPRVDPGAAGPGEIAILGDEIDPIEIPPVPAETDAIASAVPRWEETEDGWRIVEEDDEEDSSMFTPPAAAPRLSLPEIEPELTDDTTTAEVVPESPRPRRKADPLPIAAGFPLLVVIAAALIGAVLGAALLAGGVAIYFARG